MRLDGGNTENIVKALIKLTLEYPGKKIVVVWDNASYHSSKELNMKLEEIENLKRIQFIYLPPYSPDKNPIEHVWNESNELYQQPPARRLRGYPRRIRDIHQGDEIQV